MKSMINWIINTLNDFTALGPHIKLAELSLSDAIELAYALAKTTVIVDKLVRGNYYNMSKSINPRTGGPILICVVTRDGVRWIMSPDYAPSWREDFNINGNPID